MFYFYINSSFVKVSRMKNLLSFLLWVVLIMLFSVQGKASLEFIENRGQVANAEGIAQHHFAYYVDFGRGIAYFCPDHVEFYFYDVFEKERCEYSKEEEEAFINGNYVSIGKKIRIYRLDLSFNGANSNVEIIGESKNENYTNYYLPHCVEGILSVNSFAKIKYKNIYPGIDLLFYSKDGYFKYDFIVQAGADVSLINLSYHGAEELLLNEKGDIIIKTPIGDIIDSAPESFLFSGAEVESEYSLSESRIHFIVKENLSEGVIIDPMLTWSTYYNNNYSSDTWTKPAFTSSGEFFAACYTYCNAYPTLDPGGTAYFDNVRDGSVDLVIHKFNSNRTKIWATYYGGNNSDYLAGYTDYGKAMIVDNNDEVYVAGMVASSSTIFPTYNPGAGAFYQTQTKIHGETSFMLKFANDGTRLWATMFQHENANTNYSGIRLNGLGTDGQKIYFTGQTYRSNTNDVPLRTLTGAYNNTTFVGAQDPFIGRFSTSGVLEWCTYFNSGNVTKVSYKQGVDLHVDNAGNLLFIGRESQNSSFPDAWLKVNPGGAAYVQTQNGGDQDVLIAKFNSSMQIYWSTTYGGNGQDIPSTVISDNDNNIIIVCRAAKSTNFPTYNPGGGAFYQATKNSSGTWGSDAFIMKFSPSGVRQWATYYGGSGVDKETIFTGVGVDSYNAGNIYVIGRTACTDFPTMSRIGSYNDNSLSGTSDVVALMFNNNGVRFWATYYGGSGSESTYSSKCAVRVIGSTARIMAISYSNSVNLPLANPGGGALYENTKLTTNVNIIFEFTNTDITLPVELNSFDYNCTEDGTSFEWTTASETNSRSFKLLCWNTEEWIELFEIIAAGNSSLLQEYSVFIPKELMIGNYVRLMQVDLDGAVHEMGEWNVDCFKINDVQLYPIPSDNYLFIEGPWEIDEVLNVSVFDAIGKKYLVPVNILENKISVQVVDLFDGVYFLCVETKGNSIFKTFVKN